jgi:hypothetical protein
MRSSAFRIKCESCPRYFFLDVGDDTFQINVAQWAIAGADRLGWYTKAGRSLCKAHAMQEGFETEARP